MALTISFNARLDRAPANITRNDHRPLRRPRGGYFLAGAQEEKRPSRDRPFGLLPTGMAMDPNEMAIMARLQQPMSQPLSPAEQDAVATVPAQELKSLPADQRAVLMEHLDSGFFPRRAGEGVKAGLAAR